MYFHLTRRRFLVAAAGCAGALCVPALAARAKARRRRSEATYFELVPAGEPILGIELEDARLAFPVRILLGSAAGASNSLVYWTPAGSLLIDTATPPLGRRMVADSALVGGPVGGKDTEPARDDVVINTHHHADHTGGNWALAAAGARPRVVMHARADERVRSMLERYRAAASGGVQAAGQIPDEARRAMAVESAEAFAARAAELTPDDFAASETFDAEMHEVRVGDASVVLHHFGPGHTDNDTVVHIPEHNVVHCGDLLFAAMHPYFADDSGATCRGWIESVGRIIELCDHETTVVPGHGPVGDVSLLRRQRDYLEQLWEAVELEVARGTPKESVVQMAWPFMEGLQREQIRSRAIGAVYDGIVASR